MRGGGGLGAGLVERTTARRLTCDGLLAVAVHDPDGRVVALTDPDRYPDAALRRLLDARDAGCRWPGCPRGAPGCDAHHVVHHADGGPTTADNLLLLCPWHHHCVHEGGHRLLFDGATATIVDPLGHRVTAPAPHASDMADEPWLPDVPHLAPLDREPPRPPADGQPPPVGVPDVPPLTVPPRPGLLRRRAATRAAHAAGDDLRRPLRTDVDTRRPEASREETPPF